jgi:hypothetical protein
MTRVARKPGLRGFRRDTGWLRLGTAKRTERLLVPLVVGPGWLSVELAEARDGQPSVRFLLGPAELTGPFSTTVHLFVQQSRARYAPSARHCGVRKA